MDQDITWCGARPRPGRLCVRWGPRSPSQKSPKFSVRVYYGQTAGWINMPIGTKVGLSPGNSVLDGEQAPSPQRGWNPLLNFRPMSIVAETAAWIKMTLVMDVGLSSRDFVLDGDPDSQSRLPHIFGPCLLWRNGWVDQDTTWHESMPQPRRPCVRWGHSTPPRKGGGAPSPIFGPFLLWPNGWMHQVATRCGGKPQPRGL